LSLEEKSMGSERKKPDSKPRAPKDGAREKTVEEAAYYRWLARNREHGRDLDDWLGAEQELVENIFERDAEG
jgi:hypothetical protein